ncbi:MAG TPA: rod shape-determining protein RodA [Acidimicrobiales bacterium]|nr:rod shape-determining protein RodA [Acidimicrobiales bacterium]
MTTTFSTRTRVAPGALGRTSRNPAAPWRHLDLVLVGCVAAMSALGCLMIFSATRGRDPSDFDTSFLTKQMLFVGIGFGAMVVTAFFDYRRYRELAPMAYGAVAFLLLLVVTGLGSERKGSQAWFQLGPFQLQPSELAKIVVIVTLASVIAHFNSELDARRLGLLLVVAGLPMALIMLQPDLGTTLVFVAVTMGMLLIGGAQARHIAALTVVGLIGVVVVLNSGMLETYQQCRLTSFLETQNQDCEERDAAYNLDQAKVAIGSGSVFGTGLFEGTQTRLDIVPEQHTDFIFTAVGEELGFVGGGTLLALLAIISWRIWRTAQLARDSLGTLICVGILSMFVFQVFENVGMTMGIMPITGIPLPFMSYGGSSTLTAFIAMGLVLNVHMRRFS